MVRLCYVMLDTVWFGYISFIYFFTQKLDTCRTYKRLLTGTAAVPVTCAKNIRKLHEVVPVGYIGK